MKISVLGTGRVGRTVAARLAELGHEVTIGTRDPQATLARTEPDAMGTDDRAGRSARGHRRPRPDERPRLLRGFPPWDHERPERLSEQVQAAAPHARVVKALNTLTVSLMAHPESLPEPTTVFVAGDDEDARRVVSSLLGELGHDDVVDLGDLTGARALELWMPLWLRVMISLGTADFNIRLVRPGT